MSQTNETRPARPSLAWVRRRRLAPTARVTTARLRRSRSGSLDLGGGGQAEVDANYREQLLAANVYTESDFDWVVGGGFAGTMAQALGTDGFFEVAITQGLQMDASHTLLVDDRGVPIPMRVEEMVVDGELQTGRYFLQITLDWVAVSLVP